MFTENSGLVITWVNLIKVQGYSREEVPELSNLREMVFSVLDKAD